MELLHVQHYLTTAAEVETTIAATTATTGRTGKFSYSTKLPNADLGRFLDDGRRIFVAVDDFFLEDTSTSVKVLARRLFSTAYVYRERM